MVKRIAGAIDVPAAGLGFALLALIVVVLTLGITPTMLAIGLLALLVID